FPRPSAGIKRQYDSEQERPLVVDPALSVEKRKYDLNEEITTNEDEKYDLLHQKQTLNGRSQYSGTATKNASKLLTPFVSKAYSGNSFTLPSPTPVDKNEAPGKPKGPLPVQLAGPSNVDVDLLDPIETNQNVERRSDNQALVCRYVCNYGEQKGKLCNTQFQTGRTIDLLRHQKGHAQRE
ncbi:hypothetical protein M422DRAFT_276261, partial [Sphaerobolus stellatus SS14]